MLNAAIPRPRMSDRTLVWNMLVFTLFVTDPSEFVAFGIVLAAVVMTFLPINFLHPVRVVRLRPLNLSIFAVWSVLSGYALLLHFQSPDWLMWAVMLTGFYLFCIGGIMQVFPNLGKRAAA